MAGKDLINSVTLSSRICKALGKQPPEGFNYELFLDENGQKISKSKGNGLTIDDWLAYAPTQSLALFMYQKPKTAKRLFFDVIPRQVDEYFQYLSAYEGQDWDKRLQNPVWHTHFGKPPKVDMPVSYTMLLNLVSASNAHDKEILWGFITAYMPGVTAQTHPVLDDLVGHAIRYFEDFVKPHKKFRPATAEELSALAALDERLAQLEPGATGEAIQDVVFAVGNEQGYANLRDWFQALYQILLGQDQGPRFGSFVALYGIDRTRALIGQAIEGKLAV